MAMTQGVTDRLLRAGSSILFNSTLDTIELALSADNATQVMELIKSRAREGGTEFWLDCTVLFSAVIIVVALTNCFCRCGFWALVSLPKQSRHVDKIRSGSMEYQKKAAKEREELKKKGGADAEGENRDEDFATVVKAMSEARDYMRQSESAVKKLDAGSHNGNKEQAKDTKKDSADGVRPMMRTTRKPPSVQPASCIRGMPEIITLAASTNQRYFVFGSKSKKKTVLVPQRRSETDESLQFLTRGRDLLKAGEPQVVLEELGVALPSSVRRMEVYRVEFAPSMEQTVLVVGERQTDSFFVFGVSGLCSVQLQRVLKMPGHRLVSSLSLWGVLCGMSGLNGFEGIFSFQSKDSVVELLQPTTRGGDGTLASWTSRFKVGNATAWCYAKDHLAVGGSFMREPRLAKLECRDHHGTASVELKPVVTLTSAGSSQRVLAMSLVLAGVPAFNTRNYWIILMEDGKGSVYDLDGLRSSGAPELVGTFCDTDYADFVDNSPVRMLVAVQGNAYKERLLLALLRGGNATVLMQNSFVAPFELLHRHDVYNALDGDPIEHAALLLGGRGLALCGKEDSTGIRLFELPE